jgi:chromosome segregation ATPase
MDATTTQALNREKDLNSQQVSALRRQVGSFDDQIWEIWTDFFGDQISREQMDLLTRKRWDVEDRKSSLFHQIEDLEARNSYIEIEIADLIRVPPPRPAPSKRSILDNQRSALSNQRFRARQKELKLDEQIRGMTPLVINDKLSKVQHLSVLDEVKRMRTRWNHWVAKQERLGREIEEIEERIAAMRHELHYPAGTWKQTGGKGRMPREWEFTADE